MGAVWFKSVMQLTCACRKFALWYTSGSCAGAVSWTSSSLYINSMPLISGSLQLYDGSH